LSGQWVGVLVPPGNGFQTGVPILLEIDAVQKSAVGIFRLEKDQNWFQYEVGGSFTDKKAFTLQSKQSIPLKKNQLSAPPFQLDFHYNDTSDLAFGRFESQEVLTMDIPFIWRSQPFLIPLAPVYCSIRPLFHVV